LRYKKRDQADQGLAKGWVMKGMEDSEKIYEWAKLNEYLIKIAEQAAATFPVRGDAFLSYVRGKYGYPVSWGFALFDGYKMYG